MGGERRQCRAVGSHSSHIAARLDHLVDKERERAVFVLPRHHHVVPHAVVHGHLAAHGGLFRTNRDLQIGAIAHLQSVKCTVYYFTQFTTTLLTLLQTASSDTTFFTFLPTTSSRLLAICEMHWMQLVVKLVKYLSSLILY